MAKKLRAAADIPNEVPGLESLMHNVDRWERGGTVSERYRILYCRAFGRSESDLFGAEPPRATESTPVMADITPAGIPLDSHEGLVMVRLPRGAQRVSIDVFIPSEDRQPAGIQSRWAGSGSQVPRIFRHDGNPLLTRAP